MEMLDLFAPTSWSDLSQEQLAFLLKSIVSVNRANADKPFLSPDDFSAQSTAQVATLCLFRWNGIAVVTAYDEGWLIRHRNLEICVSTADIAAAAAAMAWVGELPQAPVRLNCIDGASAVAAELDDAFSFDDWLSCEALWQNYQVTISDDMLRQMAEILYHKQGIRLREFESLSIFYWWTGLKNLCNRLYPNFFQPKLASDAKPDREMLRRNMDAQIRALTKGDITKEEHVLSLPAHRALTELDALAREYDEINRKYPSK